MKIISVGQDARDKLKQGIDLVADSVKFTLGPSGRNVVLGRVDLSPTITNDGVSIARNIEHEDPIVNEGVWIMKEALSLASKKSKDGTTTTAILTQAITDVLFDKIKDDGSIISKKVDVIAIKRQVTEACEEIVTKLKEASRPITNDEIYNVALVAGEYPWIAEIVSDVYKKIGKDGHVTIEEGIKTEKSIFSGIELGAGYQSEYFINSDDNECILENPYILITNHFLDSNFVIPVTLELAAQDVTSLILIAPDFTKDLLNRLNTTKLKTEMNVVAIKLPTYDKDDLLIDTAVLTEAKFLDKNVYTKTEQLIADIKVESLGKCTKAIITSNKTVLIGGNGDTSSRIEGLKKTLENTESIFDKDKIEQRIAYLSGGIATIKIGAESDFEKVYFKLKVENAVNSVENALREGVVKGGGQILKEIGELCSTNMLCEAIKSPYKQIQENNGSELIIPDTVIDPVKNTINAIKTACSIAGTLVTTERVISFKKENNESKD